jgi:hypothetical protein
MDSASVEDWVVGLIEALNSFSALADDCHSHRHYCGKVTSREEDSENFHRRMHLGTMIEDILKLLEEIQNNLGRLAPSGQPAVQKAITELKGLLTQNVRDEVDMRDSADELVGVLCLAVPYESPTKCNP